MVEAKDLTKIFIMLLLSYMVPIIGIGFSIYLLSTSKREHYDRWVKTIAIISLGIQLLLVFFLIIGLLTWYAN